MSMDLIELKNIFEYELKRKLAQKCRTKNEEIRFLLNSFKFYDYQSSFIIDKNKWIKGVLKTGLCGFNINDLSDVFNKYDSYNTGYINYKNFCYYIYGKEDLLPIQKNYLDNNEELINEPNNNRLKSPFNDFKPPGLYERTLEMLEYENKINSRRTPNTNLGEIAKNNNNYKKNNIKSSLNKDYYYELLQKQSPQKQSPGMPFLNSTNLNMNINNNISNPNNKNNNSNLNSNFNNNLSIQNNSFSYENNDSDSIFKKLLLVLQNKINRDNGVMYYTFVQKLKLHENDDQTITLNAFYSALRDINISFRLNDLTDFFNFIDKSKSNKVPSEYILQLIRGNLNEKRKNVIKYIYSLLDKDNMGRVPIDLIKNLYNCKLHPDVYVGFKQEEDILKEFFYTLDMYCNLYNVRDYITCDEFVEYYWGVSASVIDDNYFEDILNGVWNSNIQRNKSINSMIEGNLNINKYNNENYRKELIGNQIDKTSNYYLNNRYVNSPNKNIYNYINYDNKSSPNLLQNKSEQSKYLSPYTPIPKENEFNHERVTPYYHPSKTPLYKGVKMFRSLRHNPITNEFIMSKDTPIDRYYDASKIKNINSNQKSINIYNNDSQNNKPVNELDQLRKIIISRGQKGIFIFQKILFLYDKEKKGEISYSKFNEVLEIFNIIMDKQSINSIFYYYDKEKKGVIKYNELLNELIGNISKNRELLIKKVFDCLIKDKNDNISINDLKQRFKSMNHPDVKNRYKSEKDVYFDFAESIDIFKNYRNNLSGYNYNNDFFNYHDFLDYYKEISMSIKEDKLFEDLIFNCWNNINVNNISNNEKYNGFDSFDNYNIRIQTANQILNKKTYF